MLAGLAGGLCAAPQDPSSDDSLVRRGPKAAPKSGAGALITFNLVATDAKGEPARNLRAGDLDIRDEGRPVQAIFCRPLASLALTEPLAPNEYTNRLPADQARTTVVVLDMLNQRTSESGFEAKDLARALGKIEGIERLYLYLLTQKGQLYAVHALPAVDRAVPGDDSAWAAHAPQLLADAMRAVSEQRTVLDARPEGTASALQELALKLPAQPGPKSIVWITHSVGTLGNFPQYAADKWVQLGTDLARAGITIYAVDRAIDENDIPGWIFEQLTKATGGVRVSANIEAAIRQVMKEERSMYRVGYRPPLDNWDDTFHKIRASSSNGGVRLRAIDGYLAERSAGGPSGSFLAAAGEAGDRAEIGIRATLAPSAKGKNWVRLTTRVDAADLRLTGDTSYTGEMRVTVAYYVNGWRPDPSQEIAFPLALTAEQRQAVLAQGITLYLDRPLLPGTSKLRVVVRDVQSGAVGTLTVPVESDGSQ